jgi:hypothetical protein
MFNSSIAAHNLIAKRADTGILKSYSLEACFSMCHNVTEGVQRSPEGTVQTMNHLNFAMEVIGYSFCLSVESRSVPIIRRAIAVYDSWLFNCPKCALPTEQILIRDILGHFTLLFHNKSSSAFTQYHTDLAQNVIEVIHKFIILRCNDIKSETWVYIVRLMLGCADCIFEGPIIAVENFSNNVSVNLIRLIFETFVRSLSTVGTDPDLWRLLDKFMPRWTHRLQIIQQWNELCVCLTTHLLVHLPREASDGSRDPAQRICHLSFPSGWSLGHLLKSNASTSFVLSSAHLKFAWYRILQCIGNPNEVLRHHQCGSGRDIPKDKVLSAAIGGACGVADIIISHCFWESACRGKVVWSSNAGVDMGSSALENVLANSPVLVGRDKSLTTELGRKSGGGSWTANFSIVTVNSVIALLGGWLFEAALKSHVGDVDVEDSRALALGCLGRIFSSKYMNGGSNCRRDCALSRHTNRYLLCLRYAFDTSHAELSRKVLGTALLTSCRLISTTTTGVEVVLDDCLGAIEDVLTSCKTGVICIIF